MFLDHFKLTMEPFGVTPDPRFLYLSAQHREALASLAYGTESNRGFLALVAKPGMGKTSLLYRYLEGLRGKARTAFVFRTDCDSREFIRHVLLDLGIKADGSDLPAMHEALNQALAEEMRAGRRFVLVIDEAQNLEETVLESVRLLSNFETPWMKLMQIVIAGQPSLAEKLSRPSMTQLRQRISLVIRIAPLNPKEIDTYIDHRLSVAGCKDSAAFTAGARKLIVEHSEGIPRKINNICFNAMSLACALKKRSVDRATVLDVLADLDLESLIEGPATIAEGPKQTTKQDSAIPLGLPQNVKRLFQSLSPKLAVASLLVLAVVTGISNDEIRAAKTDLAGHLAVRQSVMPGGVLSNMDDSLGQQSRPVHVLTENALYQIGVENLGWYDPQLLEESRRLIPSLFDPTQTLVGQQILMPLVRVSPTHGQIVLPIKAGAK
jgi:type II secretory pathway predicted ATPase ExeA